MVGGWLVAGMAASNDRRDILLVVGKKRRRSEREEREREREREMCGPFLVAVTANRK